MAGSWYDRETARQQAAGNFTVRLDDREEREAALVAEVARLVERERELSAALRDAMRFTSREPAEARRAWLAALSATERGDDGE